MLDDVSDGRDHHGLSFSNAQETAACIQHRLNIALACRSPLTPEALQAIYEHTRGVPRRINILGDFQLASGGRTRRRQ